jgi:two-component system sensor histidine kinase SenX3
LEAVDVIALVVGIVLALVGLVSLLVARRRAHDAQHAIAVATAGVADRVSAVADERDRLARALDGVADGVVIVGVDGSVLYRNEVADRFHEARHSDAAAEELVGRLLDRALAGETTERELPLFGPPREVLTVRAMPLFLGDRAVGAVAFVHDVTELRRVESVRRDFVANVSHELKTPIGALGLLAETVGTAEDPAVVTSLSEQILREADRLARIVDDLLDLSLAEAQEAPVRDRVPVRVLLDEAVERVRPLALARGIPLRDEVPDDDLSVECDAGQLVSAITNLLDNAIKYSDEGGSVEARAYAEGGTAGSDRVVIEVRDHGIGIPTTDLERIFERFYRVDKARSRATGGTGLGLSIVRHVVQAHHGEVAVESREGDGSTFRLVLPLESAAGMAEAS